MVFCDGCFVPSRSVASPHHQTTERRSKIHCNLVMSLWHSFILSPCHNDIPSCRFGAATEQQYEMPQKNSHHSMIHTGVTNLRLPQCELCIQFLPRNNWVHLSGMCNLHSGEAIWYFYSLGSTREVSMWST